MRIEGKISILAAGDFNLKGAERILPVSRYRIVKRKNLSNEDILKYGGLYGVLIINSRRKLDKVFLSRCSIKTICTASKGTDHIDTDYAAKRGIRIFNSENGNYISAAEHTFALILSLIKKIKVSDELIRIGRFDFWDFERRNLFGKKIGIIGTGKVGTRVAKISKAFGMQVLANDTDKSVIRRNYFLNYYDLEHVLRNSDIVTLHIPYNRLNRKFIDRTKLLMLKPDAVFINTSRGGIVDETALLRVLKAKKKFHAGLDVFEKEPYINREFLNLRNVALTNHTAGKTQESAQSIINEILMQVKRHT